MKTKRNTLPKAGRKLTKDEAIKDTFTRHKEALRRLAASPPQHEVSENDGNIIQEN